MSKDFQVGDKVLVRALSKTGVVVRVLKGGKFEVRVAGLLLLVQSENLAPSHSKIRKRSARSERHQSSLSKKQESHGLISRKRKRKPWREVDLHGLRKDEAQRVIEREIDKAIREDLDELHIVHGRSGDTLRKLCHELLAELSVVKSFHLSEINPGMTVVRF